MAVRLVGDPSRYLKRDADTYPSWATHTIMFWVSRKSDTNAWTNWFTWGHTDWTEREVLGTMDNGDTLVWSLSDWPNGSFLERREGSTATIDAWFHVAIVNSSGTMTAYEDGVAVGTTISSTGHQPPDTYFRIGSDDPPNARIASFKIWEAALTPTEILVERDYYAAVKTGCFSNATFKTDLSDSSGNSRGWTLVGTALDFEAGPSIADAPATGNPVPMGFVLE